jgi:hypothetical protein
LRWLLDNGDFAIFQEPAVLKRTFGAAVGAVIFILFTSHIATRLTAQLSAASRDVADVPATTP